MLLDVREEIQTANDVLRMINESIWPRICTKLLQGSDVISGETFVFLRGDGDGPIDMNAIIKKVSDGVEHVFYTTCYGVLQHWHALRFMICGEAVDESGVESLIPGADTIFSHVEQSRSSYRDGLEHYAAAYGILLDASRGDFPVHLRSHLKSLQDVILRAVGLRCLDTIIYTNDYISAPYLCEEHIDEESVEFAAALFEAKDKSVGKSDVAYQRWNIRSAARRWLFPPPSVPFAGFTARLNSFEEAD